MSQCIFATPWLCGLDPGVHASFFCFYLSNEKRKFVWAPYIGSRFTIARVKPDQTQEHRVQLRLTIPAAFQGPYKKIR